MSTTNQTAAEKILASIPIPPRPTVLTELMTERNRTEPNLQKIAQIVARDVVLSAAILKTVNSPFFGLRRKLDSIEQAVVTLGLNNVFDLVTGLVLRNLNGGSNPKLSRFWDTAENTALNSAMLAKRIPGLSHNTAYTVGLFHDCGIPLMMTRFPDYLDILRIAQSKPEKLITETEDEYHSTNHATVGYLLAKNWNLSETITLTILHHHNLDIFRSRENLPPEVCGLIAVIQISEALSDSTQMREDSTWAKNSGMLLEYVGLSNQELDDLKEEIMDFRSQK